MIYGSGFRGIIGVIKRVKEPNDVLGDRWSVKFYLACVKILCGNPSEFRVFFIGMVFPEWGLNTRCDKEQLARILGMTTKQFKETLRHLVGRLRKELPRYPFIWRHLIESARSKAYFDARRRKADNDAA